MRRTIFRLGLIALLVSFGCGDSRDEAEPDADVVPTDTAVDTDASDSGDTAGDAPDTTDVSDAPDAADLPVPDAPDAPEDTPIEVSDAGDAPDAATDVDVADTPPPDVEPDPDVEPELWFELGIGEGEFALAVEGQDAMMAQGIQGGFHIWGGFRGFGFDPDGLTFEATLRDEEDTLVGAVFFEREVDLDDDGVVEEFGITVFLAPEVIPETADGAVWEYCGTLRSGDAVAEDCVTITAVCCEYLTFP